jgi:hypothetical protein
MEVVAETELFLYSVFYMEYRFLSSGGKFISEEGRIVKSGGRVMYVGG